MERAKTLLVAKTIAVTRPQEKADETIKIVERRGAKCVIFPTIATKASGHEQAKKLFADLSSGKVNYVIFMSTTGVEHLFEIAKVFWSVELLLRSLIETNVVAVGPKTAEELEKRGVKVDLVPKDYSSKGILKLFAGMDTQGKRVCLPRTKAASSTLREGLEKLGARVEEFYIYESELPEDPELATRFLDSMAKGDIDAIIFTSSLAVKNLFRILSRHTPTKRVLKLLNGSITAAAIGPTTAETMKKHGITVDVVSEKHVLEGALEALSKFWSRC